MDEVETIRIPAVDGLDPITLYIEGWKSMGGNNAASITAICFGEAWNFVAGSIGDRKPLEFFIQCDKDYLGGKFAGPLAHQVMDYDAISKLTEMDITSEYEAGMYIKEISDAYGDDFPMDMPMTQNHKYTYILKVADRIIKFLQPTG